MKILASVLLSLVVLPNAAHAQVSAIPVRLQLSTAAKGLPLGRASTVRVELMNVRGQPAPALEDTPVTLRSEIFDKPVTVTVPMGRSGVNVTVTVTKAGLATIRGDAAHLPPAHLVIAGEPPPPAPETKGEMTRRGAHPPSGTAPPPSTLVPRGAERVAMAPLTRRGIAEPAATPSAAPPQVASPAAPQPAGVLTLLVAPEQVDAEGGVWTALIGVGFLTADQQPAAAPDDIPVQFSAQFGQISPPRTTIRRGTFASPDDIRLVANRPGSNTVAALSAFGTLTKSVLLNPILPATLRVVANPATVINDGRTAVRITVMLLDRNSSPTPAPHNGYVVQLTASLGDLKDRRLAIPTGEFAADTTLTSDRRGKAVLTASAVGLGTSDAATAVFLFPWLMLAAAIIGGGLGSFLKDLRLRTRQRWSRVALHLASGAVFGAIFYVAVLFGAIGALSKVPFDITKLPAVNELGAFVLGFVGGYYGALVLPPAPK